MWSVFEQMENEGMAIQLPWDIWLCVSPVSHLSRFFRHHVGEYADSFADKNVRQYHGEPIIT